MSEKNKAIQRKNDHRHRLGSRGYQGKFKHWKDVARAHPEELAPILAIRDKRSKNFLMARTIIKKDGTIIVPDEVLALAANIVSVISFVEYAFLS